MKHSSKIIFLIATALVLTSTLIGLVSTWKTYQTGSETVAQIERLGRDSLQRIKADGDREAVAFREELLAFKKEYLKSEVQTAIAVLEKGFKDAHDIDWRWVRGHAGHAKNEYANFLATRAAATRPSRISIIVALALTAYIVGVVVSLRTSVALAVMCGAIAVGVAAYAGAQVPAVGVAPEEGRGHAGVAELRAGEVAEHVGLGRSGLGPHLRVEYRRDPVVLGGQPLLSARRRNE